MFHLQGLESLVIKFMFSVQKKFPDIFQISQIFIGFSGVFGDDFVAAAVIANHVAKRDVDIKRNGFQAAWKRVFQHGNVFRLPETVMEAVGGGIRCIARAAGGQASNEFAVKVKQRGCVWCDGDGFHGGG